MPVRQGRKGKPRRPIREKPQKRIIRVLTEGRVTEPTYLRELCGQQVKLEFGRTGGKPADLVRSAKKDLHVNRRSHKDDRFDKIWCVFDHDEHANLQQAIQEASDADIHVAFSNPCFELWLVWHVEDWSAHVGTGEIQRRCNALGITQGKNFGKDSISRLRTGFDRAKRQALRLDGAREQDGTDYGANPHSDVWRLVELLKQDN